MSKFYDSESIDTNAATAVGLTVAILNAGSNGASRCGSAVIEVKDASIWVSFTQDTPDADLSLSFAEGDKFEVVGYDDLLQMKIITQAGNGTIYVEYATA